MIESFEDIVKSGEVPCAQSAYQRQFAFPLHMTYNATAPKS
jgi:hypothetical protein